MDVNLGDYYDYGFFGMYVIGVSDVENAVLYKAENVIDDYGGKNRDDSGAIEKYEVNRVNGHGLTRGRSSSSVCGQLTL